MTRKAAEALDAAVEAARALPSDGWLAAAGRGRSVRAGRGAARARCAARSTRGPRRRRRATGSRPSWPSPTAHLVSAAAAALEALEALARAAGGTWTGGWRRCSRTRPTGSIRRRGRGSRARSAGCRWRRETLGRLDRLARPHRRRRPIPISSTGWRSSASRAANMMSRIHRHWLDPTRPLAKAVLEPAHGVLVTSATLRGGGGLAERGSADRGAAPARPDRPFRGGEPVRLCARRPKC